MNIWALADIHLSIGGAKPMDIFGGEWVNHQEKIRVEWDTLVKDDDLIILPGDISWAMTLAEAQEDLAWIADRPGTKLLLRGNHDYWWSAIGKVRKALSANMYALQNDSFLWHGHIICGSRGWLCPDDSRFDVEKDRVVYERELYRMELSLQDARRWGQERIIVAMHFPPFDIHKKPSGFAQLFSQYGVEICLYGHLHADAQKMAFVGQKEGVRYVFVAADYLGFRPALII